MSKQIEGRCPNCNHDIDKELSKYFWNEPMSNFEFICPYCEAGLEVETVPYPIFMVSLPEVRQEPA